MSQFVCLSVCLQINHVEQNNIHTIKEQLICGRCCVFALSALRCCRQRYQPLCVPRRLFLHSLSGDFAEALVCASTASAPRAPRNRASLLPCARLPPQVFQGPTRLFPMPSIIFTYVMGCLMPAYLMQVYIVHGSAVARPLRALRQSLPGGVPLSRVKHTRTVSANTDLRGLSLLTA